MSSMGNRQQLKSVCTAYQLVCALCLSALAEIRHRGSSCMINQCGKLWRGCIETDVRWDVIWSIRAAAVAKYRSAIAVCIDLAVPTMNQRASCCPCLWEDAVTALCSPKPGMCDVFAALQHIVARSAFYFTRCQI